MELRDAIKVLDSDAHARDFDAEIRPYLPEPYRNQKASLIPSEHYDRNLGGTLGHVGRQSRGAAGGHGHPTNRHRRDVSRPAVWGMAGCAIAQFQTALCRAYNDFISDYCKASPRLKAVANLPVNNPAECAKELNRAVTKLDLCGGMLVAQAHRKNLGESRSSIRSTKKRSA